MIQNFKQYKKVHSEKSGLWNTYSPPIPKYQQFLVYHSPKMYIHYAFCTEKDTTK